MFDTKRKDKDEQDETYPEKCTALLLYGFITVKVAKEYKTLTKVNKAANTKILLINYAERKLNFFS